MSNCQNCNLGPKFLFGILRSRFLRESGSLPLTVQQLQYGCRRNMNKLLKYNSTILFPCYKVGIGSKIIGLRNKYVIGLYFNQLSEFISLWTFQSVSYVYRSLTWRPWLKRLLYAVSIDLLNANFTDKMQTFFMGC